VRTDEAALAAQQEEDLYKVLGVDEDATDQEIKRAYRKLSVKYHPDKFNGDTRMFDQIREASEVLGDPDKRILYDTGGMEAVKEAEKEDQQGGAHDPFSMFFGGGQQQGSKAKKGPDFSANLEASLEDLYNGNKVPVNFKRRVVCRNCRNSHSGKCAQCGACPNEVKMVQRQMAPGFVVQQQQEVPSKEKCKEEQTQVVAEIERGMLSGSSISFPRMSEQRPGQIPGDVILKVNQKPHSRFVRHGNDLHTTIKIDLSKALLGFEYDIEHLDGHYAKINRKSITRPLQVIVLKGEGMPIHDVPSQLGDMHVTVEVRMPQKQFSKEEATWIRNHL
jgi:DnaJ-class molecular chaperone